LSWLLRGSVLALLEVGVLHNIDLGSLWLAMLDRDLSEFSKLSRIQSIYFYSSNTIAGDRI
jgi:hypothetical protein